MQQGPSRQFCFWDAKSLPDTCSLFIHAILVTIILFVTCCRLLKLRHLYEQEAQHLRTCITLHLMVALWGLLYLIEHVYSIFVYFTYLDVDDPPTDISNYSKIFALLDKIPYFIIQTILIKICIFNYKGLFKIIPAKQFKINHVFFKRYIQAINYVRILVGGLSILSLMIFSGRDYIWVASTVSVVLQLVDSIVVLAVLVYSVRNFTRKGINQSNIRTTIKKQIKKQYTIMTVLDCLGVMVNIIFLLYFPFLTSSTQACMEPVQKHWEFFIGHNLIGLTIQHLLPIIWFLKMYNYQGRGTSYDQYQDLTFSERLEASVRLIRSDIMSTITDRQRVNS